MDAKKRNSEGGPKLVRAGIFFGVALLVSLGVGLLLHSGEPAPTRTARAERPAAQRARAARPAAAEVPAVAAAMPAAVITPAVAAQPAPAPEAVEPESTEPVEYADAEAAYFSGDRERAAEMFARYTRQRPENAWGHYMLGLSRWKTGDLAGAEKAFGAALALVPDHHKSLVNLSRTLLDADRAADALPLIAQAVESEAASVDAHRVHGRVLHTLGRTDEAIDAYSAALALDPADAWALNNVGLILIETERFEDAAEHLARACEVDSAEAVFRNNLGIAQERLGDYGGAEVAFTKALELNGTYDKARVSLARVAELADVETPADPAPTPEEDVELAASDAPAPPESPQDE